MLAQFEHVSSSFLRKLETILHIPEQMLGRGEDGHSLPEHQRCYAKRRPKSPKEPTQSSTDGNRFDPKRVSTTSIDGRHYRGQESGHAGGRTPTVKATTRHRRRTTRPARLMRSSLSHRTRPLLVPSSDYYLFPEIRCVDTTSFSEQKIIYSSIMCRRSDDACQRFIIRRE